MANRTFATLDTDRRSGPVRIGRALASPVGVLVTVPLLVAIVGLSILLVGRDATRTAAEGMARHQLAEQAASVRADVAFALDQAEPLLERLRSLADPARPVDDVLVRMYDLIVGRAGVAYVSASFPDGTFRGAYLTAQHQLEVQESTPGTRTIWRVEHGALVPVRTEPADYDPRTRGFYLLASRTGARAWTEPYTFFKSHETGITCAEPMFDAHRTLTAVITVDFDVGALSTFVARPALDEARSIVFTRAGTVLAYPAAEQVPAGDKLLRHEDLHDPALEALFAVPAAARDASQSSQISELATASGTFLAAVTPIGGARAGVAVPLDWYVGTIIPEHTLLGPTHQLERSSALASALAIAIAMVLAVVLAWNILRMRRQVGAARAEARSAEARARELGSYRLVGKLGMGGMGEVWRAEHRLLARSAAIKLIRPEVMHDELAATEIRERFRREAQTLASMKSRHTIAIYDYGVTSDGTFYYVMELLDGVDLESLVRNYGPPPAARVISILAQACQSLAEAHEAGLFHRDIKPPNLFVCRAADELDIVKLLDFGIVQSINEPVQKPGEPRAPGPIATSGIADTPRLTQLGAMLGTPGFMAPEQILGMQLDGRADLYSLGCCAWWLLTGREVFPREGGEGKLLHRHVYDDVPSLAAVAPGWIPDELDRVIRACLAKEADERPADARVLARQLRAIPIPAEHAWTEGRASAWWAQYRAPVLPSYTEEVRVIMPGRTIEHRPSAANAEPAIANTQVGPPGVGP